MKVLIVEDEPELARNLSTYLSQKDMVCETAATLDEAGEKLRSHSYDLVVLDLMLPDGNGLNALRLIQQEQPEAGVLIISAKDSLDDRVRGLDLGADDYLTKPFHLPELNARLRALYRRRKLQGRSRLQHDEITLDTHTHEVRIHQTPLELTAKEYDLLLFFLANKNRVLTKQSIAEHLWGDHADLLDSYDFVYQHIKNLRKKMLSAGGKDHIKTIYGVGYKFV